MARTKESAQISPLSVAILLAEVMGWEQDYGNPDYIRNSTASSHSLSADILTQVSAHKKGEPAGPACTRLRWPTQSRLNSIGHVNVRCADCNWYDKTQGIPSAKCPSGALDSTMAKGGL